MSSNPPNIYIFWAPLTLLTYGRPAGQPVTEAVCRVLPEPLRKADTVIESSLFVSENFRFWGRRRLLRPVDAID
jgi:hypothetical protein